MASQFSTAARDAALDAIETVIGASPQLRIRTGAQPANCAASRTGTVLVTMTLPSDFMAASSGGSKAKSGTWEDTGADAAGDPGHFEIMNAAGSVCHAQGPCAAPWTASRNYPVGAAVTNDGGKVYRCTTGGVAASSGGPTGTGATIADGAAVWQYIGADIASIGGLTVNGPIGAGQAVTVNTYSLGIGGA
jgi:hypothetical protein